jgi:hypothetical protein
MSITPALMKQRQEDVKCEVSRGYIARPCFKCVCVCVCVCVCKEVQPNRMVCWHLT